MAGRVSPAASAAMTVGSAVAMGLVVALHVPSLPGHWICNLGVPWFYFASGFWFAGESCVPAVRKRIRTLLVPYFLSNLIWYPVVLVCNWIGWRYCGVERVVDESWPCLLRCLGLSPFAWPVLVPTWFLRALFAVTLIVGGLKGLVGSRRLAVGLWLVHWTRTWWMPSGELWQDFFVFGVSLSGCAWFATGMAVRELPGSGAGGACRFERFFSSVRSQLMPVYLLHAAVIVSVGWVAKAFGRFDRLATLPGDVAMWFVGIAGAIAIGAFLRRRTPRFARLLFGGR